MRKLLLSAAAAAAASIALPAHAMDVATFLAKADALKAKGPMALFSPDVKVLQGEAAKATRNYEAVKASRKAAGQPPLACPAPGQKKMGRDEFLNSLRTMPAAQQRTTSLDDAMIRVIQRRYPCR